jgi:DNA gyrase subunit A
MRLGRLTGLEVEKLQAEFDELCERIQRFQAILSEETLLAQIIKDELSVVKRRYAEPRRTEIDESVDEDIDDESLIQEEDVVVTMTHFGYVKRLPVDTYRRSTGRPRHHRHHYLEEDFVEIC